MEAKMNWVIYCSSLLFVGYLCEAKLREGDCGVCIKFLTTVRSRFDEIEKEKGKALSMEDLNTELEAICKKETGKNHRFCYYIGGTADAATRIINEVTSRLKNHVPAEKICEKLKEKDPQICDLQYEEKFDVRNVDLKKMRVKQLRKILQSWEEECHGCIEKSDFIERIEELKDKHIPKDDRTEL